VWSVPTRGPIRTFSTNDNIEHLASTDDGQYVATIGDRGVRLWETSTGKPVSEPIPIDYMTYGGPYPYHQGSPYLSLTSDGKRLAVCAEGETNLVQVWRTGVAGESPGLVTSFPGRKPLLFGPSGAWLLTGKTAKEFQRVDAATGKILREYGLRSRYGNLLKQDDQFGFRPQGWEISPNGQFAACFDFDADFPVVDLRSGEVVFEIGWPVLGARAAFTPDSRRLLIPGRDQRVGIWNLETKSKIVTLPRREVFIRFTRDGNRAVVINPDGQLSVLDGTPLETKLSPQ
jgi:WD40 repeat protein